MPYKYSEGAKKAYKTGRSPAYTDILPAEEQKERERMLREQIRREFGERPRKKVPIEWNYLDFLALNTKAKKHRKAL